MSINNTSSLPKRISTIFYYILKIIKLKRIRFWRIRRDHRCYSTIMRRSDITSDIHTTFMRHCCMSLTENHASKNAFLQLQAAISIVFKLTLAQDPADGRMVICHDMGSVFVNIFDICLFHSINVCLVHRKIFESLTCSLFLRTQ